MSLTCECEWLAGQMFCVFCYMFLTFSPLARSTRIWQSHFPPWWLLLKASGNSNKQEMRMTELLLHLLQICYRLVTDLVFVTKVLYKLCSPGTDYWYFALGHSSPHCDYPKEMRRLNFWFLIQILRASSFATIEVLVLLALLAVFPFQLSSVVLWLVIQKKKITEVVLDTTKVCQSHFSLAGTVITGCSTS